jgi:hypothetical protein
MLQKSLEIHKKHLISKSAQSFSCLNITPEVSDCLSCFLPVFLKHSHSFFGHDKCLVTIKMSGLNAHRHKDFNFIWIHFALTRTEVPSCKHNYFLGYILKFPRFKTVLSYKTDPKFKFSSSSHIY